MRSRWRRIVALAGAVALGALGLGWNSELVLRARHLVQAHLPDAAVTTVTMGRVGDIPMFLNPSDEVITPALIRYRVWELPETQWFLRSIREGDTVVDIGANVGYYTLLASKLVGDAGRVFAFEPDPESFALLERNSRLNGLRNVVLEQKAVSNEEGSIRLYLAKHNKGDHRIYQTPADERPFVEVEAVVLDRYFADHLGGIDFVKIDTQGAEMAILDGMEEILRANEEIMMSVEYWPYGLHEFGVAPRRLTDFLADHDFRFFDLSQFPLPEVDHVQLYRGYSVGMENATNLLLVRGRSEVLDLRRQLQFWRWVREEDPSRREEAQREIAGLEERLRGLGPDAPGFPRELAE